MGQDGERIAVLETEVEVLKDDMKTIKDDVKTINKTIWMAMGALIIVNVIIEVFVKK